MYNERELRLPFLWSSAEHAELLRSSDGQQDAVPSGFSGAGRAGMCGIGCRAAAAAGAKKETAPQDRSG